MIRCGFVSNSSSCAFILYGRELAEDEVESILNGLINYYKGHPEEEEAEYYLGKTVEDLLKDPYDTAEGLYSIGIEYFDEEQCGSDVWLMGGSEYVDYFDKMNLNKMKKTYEEGLNTLKEKFGIELIDKEPSLYGVRADNC